jgi:hypothetical protein
MKTDKIITSIFAVFVVITLLISSPQQIRAHCDTLDGPVVLDAKKALEHGDVTPVLKWVKKDQEAEIRDAFQKTLAVRAKGPEAKELADRYFFETLVRIHRAGEGAPYDGLKPAGADLGPAIPAADKALESGNIEPVLKLLTDKIQEGVQERFKHVIAKKNFKKDDIAAGREFVEAYVTFMHYVEGIYEASTKASHGHHAESSAVDKETHTETH